MYINKIIQAWFKCLSVKLPSHFLAGYPPRLLCLRPIRCLGRCLGSVPAEFCARVLVCVCVCACACVRAHARLCVFLCGMAVLSCNNFYNFNFSLME